MTYDQERKEKISKIVEKRETARRMKLYLVSPNIQSYIIERDLQDTSTSVKRRLFWWNDRFIIYWVMKEHRARFAASLLLYFIIVSSIVVGLYAMGIVSLSWLAIILEPLVFAHVLCIYVCANAIFKDVANISLDDLGISTRVNGRSYWRFGTLDAALSSEAIDNEITKSGLLNQ